MANIFLKNDGIIRDPSLIYKASLAGANDVSKQGFHPGGYDLGDDFILGITEAYGSKVVESYGICTLGDETEVGGVDSGVHSVRGESFLTKLNYGGPKMS